MRYRRVLVPGATYFFTLTLQNRKSDLLIQRIDELRFAFRKVQKNHPFYINAVVVLPDHCHLILTLPNEDMNYSKRLRSIKSIFSMQIIPGETISQSRQKKGERGIWQRRYWEHLIRDTIDYEHHVNYIHNNPVKHGYVKNPIDWRYSSIHRFISQGILSENWACDLMKLGFGE